MLHGFFSFSLFPLCVKLQYNAHEGYCSNGISLNKNILLLDYSTILILIVASPYIDTFPAAGIYYYSVLCFNAGAEVEHLENQTQAILDPGFNLG